jgi:SAM-dependent methyltransferase
MWLADWIESLDSFRWRTSAEYWYDAMTSQSGFSLPVLYEEFDIRNRSHWQDEGRILDFVITTRAHDSRVLDFGPGDGWPSLRMADIAAEVVGVDASETRVRVCSDNAARLEVGNATFVHVNSGAPLPFGDASFDAVVAASSIEQSPDPYATLSEIARVLKRGGRLRIYYEGLDQYRDGRETEGRIRSDPDGKAVIEMTFRDPDHEQAVMLRIVLRTDLSEVGRALRADGGTFDPQSVDEDMMSELRNSVVRAEGCRLRHPDCRSYVEHLKLSGFSVVAATHDGGTAAAEMFDSAHETTRIKNHAELRSYLEPIVTHVVSLAAPDSTWITAEK